ncbi:MAG: tetraacyldisaccharide 4'-kinase, partial [Acidobacteriota bacterium]
MSGGPAQGEKLLPHRAPLPPRAPWQRFYGWVHARRRARALARAKRLPAPVISIGNLHWGGTGKTPMVAAVAAHLRDRGHRVAILSRGYRRSGTGVQIVSRGEGPLLGPKVAGDEPVLLAGLLPGVAVVVDADRHRAGLHAVHRLHPAPDLFLLDDGFSHVALARDLDLLLFPALDPFAGGRLAPSGRLREPLASSRHADAAVLTGRALPPRGPGGEPLGRWLLDCLRPHGFTGVGFAAPTRILAARWVGGAEGASADGGSLPAGAPVLLVSAIARPARVHDAARAQGFAIVDHLVYPDHHPYPA